jgi:signal transduction histidine kinase
MNRRAVLLVEDNPALADNLGDILEGAGYRVRSAASCADARIAAAQGGFDVALVDVRLPDGDGIELAPALKSIAPDGEIILLTGFATLESAISAVRAGAWAYLVKPCAPPDLLIALGQAMRQVGLQKEKRELAQRAQTAEKLAALGTMAAGLAHEIRNPLNAAQLQLGVAQRRLGSEVAPDISGALECLDLVRAEMQRLNEIVESVLVFARPPVLHQVKGDLSQTVASVARFLAPEAATAGITLHVHGTEEPQLARYDEGRVKQVLMNLVRNAVEAAGAGGEVWISLQRHEEGLELKVEDSGPGVPDGIDPFVPFFTTKSSGTGLGLPIAYRILLEHGGTLALARGEARTTFIAQLPALGS